MTHEDIEKELQDALFGLMQASDDMLRALAEEKEIIAHNPRVMLAMINLVSAKMELGNVSGRAIDEEFGS